MDKRARKHGHKVIEHDTAIAIMICLLCIIMGLLMWLFLNPTEARAGVITGEKHLGGASWAIDQYIAQEGHSPYTEDIELLAEVMYHENWSTDKDHEAARLTGAVVLNRIRSKDFPNSIKAVLYQRNPVQYTTTKEFFEVEIPRECYMMAIDLLVNGTRGVPRNVVYQSKHEEFGSGVWKEINGEYFNYE